MNALGYKLTGLRNEFYKNVLYFCNMFLRLNNFLNNSDKEFSSDIAQQNYDGCRSVISSPYLIFIKHLRPPSLYQNDTNKNFARIFKFFRNRREILKSFRMWSIRKCIAQLRCYDFKVQVSGACSEFITDLISETH